MKKVLVSLAIIATLGAKAQLRETLKLGEIKRAGIVIADLKKTDSIHYVLAYNDISAFENVLHKNPFAVDKAKEVALERDVMYAIKFTAVQNELAALKQILKSQCAAEKGAEKSFELGDNSITLKTERGFGRSGLKISIIGFNHETGSFHILETDIDLLFGK